MTRFDGTLARQLDLLIADDRGSLVARAPRGQVRPTFRLLKQDVYLELARRRRRAQIAARHALDRTPERSVAPDQLNQGNTPRSR
jgi:hypothetical protein